MESRSRMLPVPGPRGVVLRDLVQSLGPPSTAFWAMINCSICSASGPTFNGLLGCDQVQYLLWWADLQRPFGL